MPSSPLPHPLNREPDRDEPGTTEREGTVDTVVDAVDDTVDRVVDDVTDTVDDVVEGTIGGLLR